MYILGEVKIFRPKSCYLRPLSNLFINVMQKPGPDLPYGRVLEAPCSDGKTFFRPLPILGRKMSKNLQIAKGSQHG